MTSSVAVVGAGWAGAAAAITLARAGVAVTVFEAAKIAGGRARNVEKDARSFDNGQHLLLGAYNRSLALIESLHGDRLPHVIERRVLAMNTAPNIVPSLSLRAGFGAAPLHLATGLLAARGLSWGDKAATAGWSAKHLLFARPDREMTVAALLAEQPKRVRELLWEPLCVAALNTPAERASAAVFVEVLRRAFLTHRSASDMLIPRVNLSALLPDPALAQVEAMGGTVLRSSVVMGVSGNGIVTTRDATRSFDRVVIATGPQHVARLIDGVAALNSLASALGELRYEPITTLHYEFTGGMDATDAAMLMLDGAPGQWLFAHRLANGRIRASVVISAHHRTESEASLLPAGLTQLRRSFALPEPLWSLCVTEKRATYACTPAQVAVLTALPHRCEAIHFAGDWCLPQLPATLESAVISGEQAAHATLQSLGKI